MGLPTVINGDFPFVPVSVATSGRVLPEVPGDSAFISWPDPTGVMSPTNVPYIFLNYEELPQDAGHIRTRLSGITGNDLEWSIDAFAEKYETNLGHVGTTGSVMNTAWNFVETGHWRS